MKKSILYHPTSIEAELKKLRKTITLSFNNDLADVKIAIDENGNVSYNPSTITLQKGQFEAFGSTLTVIWSYQDINLPADTNLKLDFPDDEIINVQVNVPLSQEGMRLVLTDMNVGNGENKGHINIYYEDEQKELHQVTFDKDGITIIIDSKGSDVGDW